MAGYTSFQTITTSNVMKLEEIFILFDNCTNLLSHSLTIKHL